jgi:hypothetical protein
MVVERFYAAYKSRDPLPEYSYQNILTSAIHTHSYLNTHFNHPFSLLRTPSCPKYLAMATSGFKIGIEVEMLLTLRGAQIVPDLEHFANGLVKKYNQSTNGQYPKMHSDIDGMYDGPNEYLEWSITDDASVRPTSPNQCK